MGVILSGIEEGFMAWVRGCITFHHARTFFGLLFIGIRERILVKTATLKPPTLT